MSKATSAAKLVKWLANQADDVVASADDLAQFGPQAARVRALLSFLPTMSDDALRTSSAAQRSLYDVAGDAARGAASDAASGSAAMFAPSDAALAVARDAGSMAVHDAAKATAVSDLISPENYRILTNPLAAGRAVDVLGSRPRNQGTPFLDVVRNMRERKAIAGPRDVVVASRLANKYDDDIIETALTLMADGMSAEEAMRAARML